MYSLPKSVVVLGPSGTNRVAISIMDTCRKHLLLVRQRQKSADCFNAQLRVGAL